MPQYAYVHVHHTHLYTEVLRLVNTAAFNNCYSGLMSYTAPANSYWLVSTTHINATLINDNGYSYRITAVELV